MADTKPASGLTDRQVDAITLEICHARALTKALFELSPDDDEIGASLFPILLERFQKITDMVMECGIGGRQHG